MTGFYEKPAGTKFLDGLPGKPKRVWTVFPGVDRDKPFTPKHMSNAFLEDYVHDWTWRGDRLRYFSRVVDPEDSVWLFCEFDKADI